MTEFNIKWDKMQHYFIEVGKLDNPYDICKIMKKQGTRKYVYKITYLGQNGMPNFTIKYGMSADNSRNYGERTYRQIAHCKSWGNKRVKGSSGAEWLIIEEDILNNYGIQIDHTRLILEIIDLTTYPFMLEDEWLEVNKIESHYIKEYEKIYGQKPIGNINDEHNAHFRPFIKKTTLRTLFV